MSPKSRIRVAVAALALGALAACAKAGAGGPAHRDRNLISYDEIVQFDERLTAQDVIRRLRPAWLDVRGTTSLRRDVAIAVYVNRQRSSDGLTRYMAGEIREIRYLNAIDATTQFGTDHGSGAILISLR